MLCLEHLHHTAHDKNAGHLIITQAHWLFAVREKDGWNHYIHY